MVYGGASIRLVVAKVICYYPMPQSLTKNYVHLVWSTKNRKRLIFPPVEGELYKYIGGICVGLECHPVAIGGHQNHVHVLCNQSKSVPAMTIVQKIKANSSRWMKEQDPSLANFSWQAGYAAFSVDYRNMDGLIRYIRNQHAHHTKKNFKNEYVQLLQDFEMEYDEKYVWD